MLLENLIYVSTALSEANMGGHGEVQGGGGVGNGGLSGIL